MQKPKNLREFMHNLRELYSRQTPLNKVMSAWGVIGLPPLLFVLALLIIGESEPWVFTTATVALIVSAPPHIYFYVREATGFSVPKRARKDAEHSNSNVSRHLR
jgi:hypothetical protein